MGSLPSLNVICDEKERCVSENHPAMTQASKTTVLMFRRHLKCIETKHIFEMHMDHSVSLSQDSLIGGNLIKS